jgi:hypothetical protein
MRTADREASRSSHSLSPERIRLIEGRARALGLSLTIRGEGQLLELVAPISR